MTRSHRGLGERSRQEDKPEKIMEEDKDTRDLETAREAAPAATDRPKETDSNKSTEGMIWQLKLIGIHARKYLKLMDVLREAASRLKGVMVVRQVTDIDAIIDSKVDATPALLIDNEVLVENVVPDAEHLHALLQRAFEKKMEKKKAMRILVPVDFSEPAKNALRYALHWARDYELQVEVIHAFASALADPAQPYFVPVREEEQRAMEDRLAAFVEEVHVDAFAEVRVHIQAIAGYPVETITEVSKDPSVAMVIMATRGEHDLLEKMFGSVSSAVSQLAWSPVLLVPPGVSYVPYRNIVYATNLEATDKEMVQQVLALARFFRANVHFVHVIEDAQQAEKVEDAIFEQVFGGGKLPEVALHLVGIRDEKPWEALSKYTQEHRADLLITVTRHRSFWERLMHRSVTKRLALGTVIPMLVLHLDSHKEDAGVWLPQHREARDEKG